MTLPKDKRINFPPVWYLYIARCKNSALYTGISTDPKKRIQKHNLGKGSKAVSALGRPVNLVYLEKVGAFSEALKRESQIKKLPKSKKEELVKNHGL